MSYVHDCQDYGPTLEVVHIEHDAQKCEDGRHGATHMATVVNNCDDWCGDSQDFAAAHEAFQHLSVFRR